MVSVIEVPEKNKNVHAGHRSRVKERFCESGLSSFADHNILEFVLFYSVPRKDTNELAHKLIEHFGSLYAVFEASVERLMEVPGISYNSAVLIRLFPEVNKRYMLSKRGKNVVFNTMDDVAAYVPSLFLGDSVESFYIICLDAQNRVICNEKHSTGSVISTDVRISTVIDSAVRHKAVGVLLAHNHPSTIARPSAEDISTTANIKEMLGKMKIKLIDHVIVGYDGKCASMSQLGLLDDIYGVTL